MAEIIYDSTIQDVLPARFLEYSVSVLKDRAIPDGFDGLKPIHRRVLLAMHDLGLSSTTPYRKCAKTIGEVLGKYHPHGDQSAYEALVGLAQDFNMRYPLVDGSGNFGSVNGDPAAAMRYTEARLSPFGELMLEDVAKLSPTKDNFDNSTQEAVTLSTYWPNLLCNPCNGIAVGLATKFAPHYAKDVYTALITTIEQNAKGRDISLDELIDIIKAPDFPTGAQIINGDELRKIYTTGKGSVALRAKYRMEKDNIIFYEIPYKVTPKSILEDIAKLDLSDIKDIRDESSLMNGLRLVVELRKGSNSEYIVNRLFKDTGLQSNYSVNMVAILGNRPKADLNLKDIVEYYLDNLKRVHRRSKELARRELLEKLFVVNTLLKAIDLIEEIIRIVRTEDEPIKAMMEQLGFTKEEAEYIYEIKIRALSKANKLDLDKKKAAYEKELARVEQLLSSNQAFLKDLAKQLAAIRDGKLLKDDVRRTEILTTVEEKELDMKSFVKKEEVDVFFGSRGSLKVTKADSRSKTEPKLREEEYLVQTESLTTHDDLLLITNMGRAYILPLCKLPIVTRAAQPKPVSSYLSFDNEEQVVLLQPLAADRNVSETDEQRALVFVTAQGVIKRVKVSDAAGGSTQQAGVRVMLLDEGDRIVSAELCEENSRVLLFTSKGRGLLFNVDDEKAPVRIMGKAARGVAAIELMDQERVLRAAVVQENFSVLILTVNGLGKRIESRVFKLQKRRQAAAMYVRKSDEVADVLILPEEKGERSVFAATSKTKGSVISTDAFPLLARTVAGKPVLRLEDEDRAVSMTLVYASPAGEEEDLPEAPPETEKDDLDNAPAVTEEISLF